MSLSTSPDVFLLQLANLALLISHEQGITLVINDHMREMFPAVIGFVSWHDAQPVCGLVGRGVKKS